MFIELLPDGNRNPPHLRDLVVRPHVLHDIPHVIVHLATNRLEILELGDRTDIGFDFQIDVLSIQIPIEMEQKRLDRDGRQVIDRRTWPDARHT